MQITIGGLDPSYNNFGMSKGLLDLESGEFTLSSLHLETSEPTKIKNVRKNSDDLERARKLSKALHSFLGECHLVCVEIPVGSQSARAMCSYGACIGILGGFPQPLIQVTAKEVKLAGAGNANASKQDMINWATSEFPDANWLTKMQKGQTTFTNANEHLADSLGAIYAGVKTSQFSELAQFLQTIKGN